jgi:hypothetical protein
MPVLKILGKRANLSNMYRLEPFIAAFISKKSIPLFRLCRRAERLVLGDVERMNWKVFGRSEGYFVKQLEGREFNMNGWRI